MNGNGMPCNLKAEEAVLGACMLDSVRSAEVVDAVSEIVGDWAWYSTAHREIWRAMWALRERMVAIDQLTVCAEIEARGNPANITPYKVVELMRETATDTMAVYHAKIVAEAWRRRRLITESQKLLERARDLTQETNDVVAEFAQLPEMLGMSDTGGVNSMDIALGCAVAAVEEAVKNPKELHGVPTGLFPLDQTLDGWQPGELVLVAGRPSMGKTALGLHFVRHAVQYCPAFLISAEMRAQALALRIIAADARVDSHRARRGRLTPSELDVMRQCRGRRVWANLHVADKTFDLRTAMAQARHAKREHGIGLLMVDYLQLLKPAEKADVREREVASLGRDLKRLAEELEIPIIAMAQLNRAVEARTSKRPQMSDLRESGALEQDADVVLLLHRSAYYGESDGVVDQSHLLEIIIAKNRNGAVGTVEAYYELETGFIAPWADREYAPAYRESSDREDEY